MRSLTLVFALALPLSAIATPAGISGFSGKGGSSVCNSCHTGGTVPTVALTGPATLVAGMTGNYTVTITGGAAGNAGIGASLGGANSGSAVLTAGPGTRILNGEIVQSTPMAFAAGSAVFTFAVKAPLTAGTFTISVAGLSSNNNAMVNGDEAGTSTMDVAVSLTSGAPPVGSPDGGAVAPPLIDGGMASPPAAPADGGTKKPDQLPTGNGNNRYNANPLSDGVVDGESGCSSTGGTPMVVLVALVGGALLIRARRRTKTAPNR